MSQKHILETNHWPFRDNALGCWIPYPWCQSSPELFVKARAGDPNLNLCFSGFASQIIPEQWKSTAPPCCLVYKKGNNISAQLHERLDFISNAGLYTSNWYIFLKWNYIPIKPTIPINRNVVNTCFLLAKKMMCSLQQAWIGGRWLRLCEVQAWLLGWWEVSWVIDWWKILPHVL